MANSNMLNRNKISLFGGVYKKFFTSFLGYLFILTCSIIIIIFANKRGNPGLLLALYYSSLLVNSLQLLTCISQLVYNRLGYFSGIFMKVEKILAIVWSAIIVSQFVSSNFLFIVFRFDMLLITILQLLAITSLILFTNKIDYQVNRKFNKLLVGNIDDVRSRKLKLQKETIKLVIYSITTSLILVTQILVLLLPKIPPRIDDIFSESRTLQYVYSESEDGYLVKDVYSGLNRLIIIPLTYNSKPVVGILSGAIQDDGIINQIQIGEFNSKRELVSNVKTIESNAIILNSLNHIDIPSSVNQMRASAIFGNNIETINYHSNYPLSMESFQTPKIKNLNLLSETHVIDVDFSNHSTLNVNVPISLYNTYREINFSKRRLFKSNNNENIVIVDFETGTNQYLDSQIIRLNEGGGYLNITSLKNSNQETSSFIKDTVLYNLNNYSTEGFESKQGYVFRGWYRDSEWTMECLFNDTTTVFFNTNTTIYAKWLEVKTVELDWSNYSPINTDSSIIQYVDSLDPNESIVFPKHVSDGGEVNRIGFHSLSWKYEGMTINRSSELFGLNSDNNTLQLKAEWKLDAPIVTTYTKVNSNIIQGSNLVFTFADDQINYFTAQFQHSLDTVAITYNWKKISETGIKITLDTFTTTNSDTVRYGLRNHNDSGVYEFEVIATNNTGETSRVTMLYNIQINKKDIDISSFQIPSPAIYVYNGNQQRLNYNFPLPLHTEVSVSYLLNDTYTTEEAPVYANLESYIVKYTFSKSGPDQENYNSAYANSSIRIQPKPVTANWNQADIKWSTDHKIMYDGTHQILLPSIIGLNGNDSAEFILSNTPKINAGTYTSVIIGITNPNYILDLNNSQSTKTWSIIPKPITTSWNTLSRIYSGNNQIFELKLTGLVTSDASSISLNDFVYASSIQDVSYDNSSNSLKFNAKNVGDYNIVVSSFLNSNYSLPSISQTAVINPALLSVNWSNLTSTYTGHVQNAQMRITGFKNGDENLYNIDNLLQKFSFTSDVDSYSIGSSLAGQLTILFNAVNAGSYSISLTGKNVDNYIINSSNNTYVINPKLLSGTWNVNELTYNGNIQSVSLIFQDIYQSDLANMFANDFNVIYDCISFDILAKGTTSLTLGFYAKDAGQYTVNINAMNLSKFNGNYTFQTTSRTFNIRQRIVSLDWDYNSFIFNGQSHMVTAQITNIIGDDLVNLNYISNQAVNAGIYTTSVSVSNPNYTTNTSNNHIWEIRKKEIEVNLSTSEFTYDGTYKYFDFEYSGIELNDLINLEKSDFTYTFNHPTLTQYHSSSIVNNTFRSRFRAIDARSYMITLANTSSKLNNYTFNFTNNMINILALTLTYSWNYENNFIYNQSSYNVSVTFTNLCTREDTLQLDVVLPSYTDNSKINVGDYIATIQTISNPNYKLDGSEHTLEWRISPRILNISWNNPTLVFNASHQQKLATATNLLGSDSIDFLYKYKTSDDMDNITSTVNKGNYYVYIEGISGSQSSNYILPHVESGALYEINPLTLSASLTKEDYTYNGAYQSGATLIINNFPTLNEAQGFTLVNLDYSGSGDVDISTSVESNSRRFIISAKNVGVYVFNLLSSNNANYIIDTKTTSFVINPLAITVSWPNSTYLYDGNIKSFTPTISNKIGNDIINISYAYSGASYLGNAISSTSMKDAGDYTLLITGVDNPNYTIQGLSSYVSDEILAKRFIINRKAITITPTNVDRVYNGNYQGVTMVVSGYISADQSLFAQNPLQFTHTGNQVTYSNYTIAMNAVNVGTYNIKITGLDSTFDQSNYYLSDSSKIDINYVINKATIAFSWSSSSLTYNGTSQSVTATITSTKFNNVLTGLQDDIQLTYSNNTAVNAGSYIASVTSITGSSAGNYALPTTLTTSWTINKRILTLTWSTINSFTYDGTYRDVSLSISNFITSDIMALNESSFNATPVSMSIHSVVHQTNSVALTFKQINAGTYYYQLSSFVNAHYNTNYSFNAVQNTMVINKLTASLSWSTISSFTYNSQTQIITCQVSNTQLNQITGEPDVVNLTITNNSKTLVGDYTAAVTAVSNANYQLPAITTKGWSIVPINLSPTWSGNNSYIYDSNNQTITLILDNYINSEENTTLLSSLTYSFTSGSTNITPTLTRTNGQLHLTFTIKNAGTYNFTVTNSSGNYRLATPATKTVVISPKVINVTSTSTNSFTYSGTNQGITFTFPGIASSDIASFASFLTPTGATSTTSSYSGDTLTYHMYGKNAGSYTFTLNKSASLTNYSFTNQSKTVTIAKASLSTTWIEPANLTYSASTKTTSLKITGFVNGEQTLVQKTNFASTATIDTIRTVGSDLYLDFNVTNQGIYDYTVSSFNDSNYTYTSTSKSVTISPINLIPTWSGDNEYVYSGDNISIVLTLSGYVNSQENTTLLSSLTYSFTSGSTNITPTLTRTNGQLHLTFTIKNAGTYNFTVTNSSGNYRLSTPATKTVVISPRQLSIVTPSNTFTTYNGLSQCTTFTVSNIASSDIATLSSNIMVAGANTSTSSYASNLMYIDACAVNAGVYNILLTKSSMLTNYTMEDQTSTLTIDKKVLTNTWSTSTGNNSDVYDGNPKIVSLTITGFMNGDKFTSSRFSSNVVINSYDDTLAGALKLNFDVIDAGEYSMTVYEFNNSNYIFTNTGFDYNVTKASLVISYPGESVTTYNGVNQYKTITINGLAASDYNNLVIQSLDYTTTGNPQLMMEKTGSLISIVYGEMNTGVYTFHLNSISNQNYNLLNINDTYTIQSKMLTVELESQVISDMIDFKLVFSGVVSPDFITEDDYYISYFIDEELSIPVTPNVPNTYYYIIYFSKNNYLLSNSYDNHFVLE